MPDKVKAKPPQNVWCGYTSTQEHSCLYRENYEPIQGLSSSSGTKVCKPHAEDHADWWWKKAQGRCWLLRCRMGPWTSQVDTWFPGTPNCWEDSEDDKTPSYFENLTCEHFFSHIDFSAPYRRESNQQFPRQYWREGECLNKPETSEGWNHSGVHTGSLGEHVQVPLNLDSEFRPRELT